MTLPRSSGWTRTWSTRPLRKLRLLTSTSSGKSTMPRTKCSRASMSTSVSAARIGRCGLGLRSRPGGPLAGRLGRFGVAAGRLGPRLRAIGLGRLRWLVRLLALGLAVTGLTVTALALTGVRLTGLRLTGLRVTRLGFAGLGLAGLGLTGLGVSGLGVGGPAARAASALRR